MQIFLKCIAQNHFKLFRMAQEKFPFKNLFPDIIDMQVDVAKCFAKYEIDLLFNYTAQEKNLSPKIKKKLKKKQF